MFKWENSRIGRYKILKVNKKKYLIDTFDTYPYFLLFDTSLDKVKLKMFELPKENSQWNKATNTKNISTVSIVLITQPLSNLIYKISKQYFVNNDINGQQILKIIFFMVSILLSILCFLLISKIDKSKMSKELTVEKFDKELIVDAHGQKNYLILTMLVLLIIIGILYFKSTDGSEAIFLTVTSIITFGCLVLTRYIPQTNFKEIDYEIKDIKNEHR